MGKLYMQWQYDPQKAQLEQKAQICAKFHKLMYNSFCTAAHLDGKRPNIIKLSAVKILFFFKPFWSGKSMKPWPSTTSIQRKHPSCQNVSVNWTSPLLLSVM